MKAEHIRDYLLLNALWLGLLWGFAEGTVFFIVPDILISAVALFSLRRSLLCMAQVLVGSLCAGTFIFFATQAFPEPTFRLIHAIPFVTDSMFATVQADYTAGGAWALVKGPLSGIPYKIYALHDPAYVNLPAFLAVSIPARLERFLVTWLIFAAVGYIFRRQVAKRPAPFIVGHVLYWIGAYILYWSSLAHE